ncbi:TetR/AcrR family transcriptional regulator [Steroidobacter sp. S1-65]|uniref:TetR/AcrR family transcriptional regulator n=1 Tax=Steroidobacter gossypii TaxID=2805490 RepID=A0ABS1WU56_9GAMM|nr:TetR/AcrR family transcriptional regulator [Steroidobacter gossypii]MBM0104497.1 TetR/AcrR family transcriptional regulator [Steroidobacter gossypii]
MSASDKEVTAPPSSGRPRKSARAGSKYARKQQTIIAAASEIMNRDGVKGMTLADVASRVGLLTTSITYYFRKKEDLAVACFLDAIGRTEALVDMAAQESEARERVQRLLQLWLQLRHRIVAGEEPPVALFGDMRTLQKPQRTVVGDAYRRFFAKLCALFETPECSWMTATQRAARAHILSEQVFWAVIWLRRYDVDDFERVHRRICDILLNGFAGRGRTWRNVQVSLDDMLPAASGSAAQETFLIAATRLINERGYRGASVEKISERLNVTKGSFYYHHDAKDDLVVACFQRSFDTMRRIQRTVLAQSDDQWEQLMTLAAALIVYQMSERGPLLRTSALVALPLSMRQEMIDAYARVSNRFAGVIADGITAGSIRAIDPMIGAQVFSATLNASAEYRWWVPGATGEQTHELYAKPMLMGLFAK